MNFLGYVDSRHEGFQFGELRCWMSVQRESVCRQKYMSAVAHLYWFVLMGIRWDGVFCKIFNVFFFWADFMTLLVSNECERTSECFFSWNSVRFGCKNLGQWLMAARKDKETSIYKFFERWVALSLCARFQINAYMKPAYKLILTFIQSRMQELGLVVKWQGTSNFSSNNIQCDGCDRPTGKDVG